MDGSRFGLEIVVQDPVSGAGSDAWIEIGPEKGLHAETALRATFAIDVSQLSGPAGGTAALPFLRLSQLPGPGGERVRLSVFWNDGGWEIGVETWDARTGRLIPAGRSPLSPPGERPETGHVHLDVQWTAASDQADRSPGQVRLARMEPGSGPPTVLLEREIDNVGQAVSHLRLGVMGADQPSGLSGVLRLDQIELRRGLGPAPLTKAHDR